MRDYAETAQQKLREHGIDCDLRNARRILSENASQFEEQDARKQNTKTPMSDEELEQIARRKAAGESWRELAREYEMSISGLRGRVIKWRKLKEEENEYVD